MAVKPMVEATPLPATGAAMLAHCQVGDDDAAVARSLCRGSTRAMYS